MRKALAKFQNKRARALAAFALLFCMGLLEGCAAQNADPFDPTVEPNVDQWKQVDPGDDFAHSPRFRRGVPMTFQTNRDSAGNWALDCSTVLKPDQLQLYSTNNTPRPTTGNTCNILQAIH